MRLIAIVRALRKAAREGQEKPGNLVKSGSVTHANCMDCPEHELLALHDPDDWFSHDARISCRAADGRTIVDCMPSGCLGERVPDPSWCPRRNAPLRAKP